MKNFNLVIPGKIVFGADTLSSLPKHILNYGKNIILICGKNSLSKSGHLDNILSSLDENKIKYKIENVSGEPTVESVDKIIKNHRGNKKPNVIVCVGGGSVIDTGKALSGMLYEEGSVKDFLELVGTKTPSGKKVPLIAVPTTSGTGSETTKNGVIKQTGETGFKRSIRHDNYIPNISIIDPNLTITCPQKVTIESGIDAFCQLFEAYVCSAANDLTDALAFDGLIKMQRSLVAVCTDKADDIEARSDVSYASMLSGICIANAGLTTIHGMASTIGGLYDTAGHGAACAALLLGATVVNLQKIKDFEPNNPSAEKYAKVGAMFLGVDYNPDKKDVYFRSIVDTFTNWKETLNIQTLSQLGVSKDDFWKILEFPNKKANPVDLTDGEMEEILEMSY